MNARFEFGKNFPEITNFKYYPKEAVGGSQYNTLFDLRVQSMDGIFSGVGDFEVDIKQIVQFANELDEMYALKRRSVKLESLTGDEEEIVFIMEKTGQLTVCGTITNFTHTMKFEFKADQTALPMFIKGIKEILMEYDL